MFLGLGIWAAARKGSAIAGRFPIRHPSREGMNLQALRPSGGLLDRVMLQQSAQSFRTLDFPKGSWLGGIIEVQRNDITDALVRALSVMMALDRSEGATQVGLTQQNQIVKRLTDFPDVAFGVRVGVGRGLHPIRIKQKSLSPSSTLSTLGVVSDLI